MQRYHNSLSYHQRACAVTPGGAQTLSKRANRFPLGAYPTALTHGHGPYVWDVDGNKYIDFICGLAAMTLGYARREIDEEVRDQIVSGVTFSLAHPRETFVAEQLCRMIPCAEMVRFVKTGSEATEAAIRVARKATGRDKVLTVAAGYHSWHSWFQVVKQEHPGIPEFYRCGVEYANYNDLSGFEYWLKASIDEIAAIILEPCHYEQPNPGFLEGLSKLCAGYGIVLIFDEMVTGFRWANGGAQEYFGVTPDLACFGKACANGYPLAFLCGRRELMEHADVISGTFGGEAISLAACEAVLGIYQSEPVVKTLWDRGKQLQDGFNDIAKNGGAYAVCDGFAVKPRIRFLRDHVMCMSVFLQETAKHGVLWHPAGGNVSAAMSTMDIDWALSVMRGAMAVVGQCLKSGDWSALKGVPIVQAMGIRKEAGT